MRRHAGLRHILEWKSPKQHRRLKRKAVVAPSEAKRIREMLPGA